MSQPSVWLCRVLFSREMNIDAIPIAATKQNENNEWTNKHYKWSNKTKIAQHDESSLFVVKRCERWCNQFDPFDRRSNFLFSQKMFNKFSIFFFARETYYLMRLCESVTVYECVTEYLQALDSLFCRPSSPISPCILSVFLCDGPITLWRYLQIRRRRKRINK